MSLDLPAAIRSLGRGPRGARDLERGVARELFAAMLDGAVPDLELGAILVAWRIKGESADESLGCMDALATRVARLELPRDLPRPVVLPSYNGARRHANLTPLLALLLARYGVPVLVHGLDVADDDAPDEDGEAPATDRFGRVSTARVFAELGVAPCTSVAAVERALVQARVAYAPLDTLAPGLARLLGLRARLGLRSPAHTFAKVIAPYRGQGVRVVSVTHPDAAARMRGLIEATAADAMLLRGTEGEPYANPLRCPRIECYRGGALVFTVEGDEGSVGAPPPLPAARDAATTAAWTGGALAGSQPVPAPILQQIACLLEASRAPARAPDPG